MCANWLYGVAMRYPIPDAKIIQPTLEGSLMYRGFKMVPNTDIWEYFEVPELF